MVSVQPSMHGHDDLAALFSRNLTFNPDIHVHPSHDAPKLDPVAAPAATQPIVYSISQHYHHSAHIPKPSDSAQRSSSLPHQSSSMASEAALRAHGIDPSTLTPSQLQLFRVAEAPQRRRLLELWSICPPSQGGDIPALAWSSTTVEQEECLAQMRYERQQQSQFVPQNGNSTLQGGDETWTQQQSAHEPEPYMMSGYEELMRREQERRTASRSQEQYGRSNPSLNYSQATDPVYLGPDYVRQQQQLDMASQYGAFEHSRGAGLDEAMEM